MCFEAKPGQFCAEKGFVFSTFGKVSHITIALSLNFLWRMMVPTETMLDGTRPPTSPQLLLTIPLSGLLFLNLYLPRVSCRFSFIEINP